MPDRTQIIAFCLQQLRKVASAHPDGLAKPLGVPVATLIPILATDARFARVAGPGGWWWKLADAAGCTSATSLDEIQAQLAASRRENAALKSEIEGLRLRMQQIEVSTSTFAGDSFPEEARDAANRMAAAALASPTEQLVPGNKRSREPGGWFASVLRRLGGAHTVNEVAAADQRNAKAASVACAMAAKKGLVEQAGKRGRAVLWRLKEAA